MKEKIVEYLKNPSKLFVFLQDRCNFKVLPDEAYLKLCYRLSLGENCDLKNPKTFNEKLQWLKIHDHNPRYTTMVDKFAVKKWIADQIGEEYTVPTLGVWERFEDIDFQQLPDRFVLKCTHDSGSYVICRDKRTLDLEKARKKLNKCLHKNYYWASREWPYKNVPPRIIAEPYLEEQGNLNSGHTDTNVLTDYKFLCFGGVPKIMYIAKELDQGTEWDYFDMDFSHLPIVMDQATFSEVPLQKPEQFEEMKRIAALLSRGIPHVRVDFFQIDGKLYVGELTFFQCSGHAQIQPKEWDYQLGQWINLP